MYSTELNIIEATNFEPIILLVPHQLPPICYPLSACDEPIEAEGDQYDEGDHDMANVVLFENLADVIAYHDTGFDAGRNHPHQWLTSCSAIRRTLADLRVIEHED